MLEYWLCNLIDIDIDNVIELIFYGKKQKVELIYKDVYVWF